MCMISIFFCTSLLFISRAVTAPLPQPPAHDIISVNIIHFNYRRIGAMKLWKSICHRRRVAYNNHRLYAAVTGVTTTALAFGDDMVGYHFRHLASAMVFLIGYITIFNQSGLRCICANQVYDAAILAYEAARSFFSLMLAVLILLLNIYMTVLFFMY